MSRNWMSQRGARSKTHSPLISSRLTERRACPAPTVGVGHARLFATTRTKFLTLGLSGPPAGKRRQRLRNGLKPYQQDCILILQRGQRHDSLLHQKLGVRFAEQDL